MHTIPTRSKAVLVAVALTIATVAGLVVPATPAHAAPTSTAITAQVNTDSNGQVHPGATTGVDVIPDATGRYVFFSTKEDIGVNDNDFYSDVYRKDRLSGQTVELSLAGKDGAVKGDSVLCGVSQTGAFVAFESVGSNLAGGTQRNVYVRDVAAQTTTLVSVSSNEQHALQGTVAFEQCPISADGQTVAFVSESGNLVPNDTNNVQDVFVRHLDTGTTERVSATPGGAQLSLGGRDPSLSANGKIAAFVSASKVSALDQNQAEDVYARVLATGATTLESIPANGVHQNKPSSSPALSLDGAFVAFQSLATNLDPTITDDNGFSDVFRRQRATGTVELVSQSSAGVLAAGGSEGSSISADGRYVGFASSAPNLYPADGNGKWDAFRRDLTMDRTDLVSRVSGSVAPGNQHSNIQPWLNSTGHVAGFRSEASNLVQPADDDGTATDAFVRDFALDVTPFPSIKALVGQQVLDFGGMPATQEAYDLFVPRLQNGTWSPDRLILYVARSTPWAGKRAPLVRLYWAFFLRIPDQGGMEYWTKKLTGGMTLAKAAAHFAKSSEFQNKYGALSNKAFVTLIYQNIFERNPDPTGLAYWTGKLDKKQKSRGDVMVNFSESSEGKRVLAPQADTVLIWLGMLRVMPPKVFFEALVATQKDSGQPPEIIATFARTQIAYAARVA